MSEPNATAHPGLLATARKLLEMIRFSHTLFALPFAMLASVMAWYQWHAATHLESYQATPLERLAAAQRGEAVLFGFLWTELLGIVLCMVFARSAAMAFNRLVDRHLDAQNVRTANRHLPSGALGLSQVIVFAVVCAVGFVAATLLFLPNRLPIMLSIPVLLFLLGYSFAKRFTSWVHAWLGVALALSPVAAWLALRGQIVLEEPSDLLPALILAAGVATWVTGFDLIYACQDVAFDRNAQLFSLPARIGVLPSLRVAAGLHLLTLICLACLPLAYPLLGVFYWLGVLVVAGLLVYEHAVVRPDDLSRVNLAFFRINAVISVGLFTVGTLDLWL